MIKYFRRHPILAALAYMGYYLLWFALLESRNRPYRLVSCTLDEYLPFVRFAIVPYLLWFAWVPLVFLLLLRRSQAEFWRLFDTFALGTSAALLLYTLMPTGLALRQYHPEQDIFTRLVRLIYAVDTPTNVCPSLHVFVTVIVGMAVFESGVLRAEWFRLLTVVMTASICLSTVLLDQHSVIDVLLGLVLAVGCRAAVVRLTRPEVSPRHAHT